LISGGTEVTIGAFDVPPGISAEDHARGIASTLANLAAFLESQERDVSRAASFRTSGPQIASRLGALGTSREGAAKD